MVRRFIFRGEAFVAEGEGGDEAQQQEDGAGGEGGEGGLLGEVVFEEGDDLGADDAAASPGGEDGAVDDRHQPRAEDVEHEGWHGAEAAAVAEQDVADEDGEDGRAVDEQEDEEDGELAAEDEAEGSDAADSVG